MSEWEPKVAYFCMEFGLHEEFSIYSGGLGILAGDILKAAHDMGKPMVGVGILWRQGYGHQKMGKNGVQQDVFYDNYYDFLEDTGVIVPVPVRGREIRCKIWKCQKYGNVPLYLLDAFLPENEDRLITGQLYGWFNEERVAQEMILGIGGIRGLRALGIEPDRYHFNDSHPVIGVTELLKWEMEQGKSFEEAREIVRRKILFTTHTPVMAGNETHRHQLLQYMGAYNGLTYEQMASIGGDPFSMTAAGLRMSYKANAVAKLHGETAREMWKDVTDSAPILSVTNGVHNGTWQDGIMAEARGERLWERHQMLKQQLLFEVERRTGRRFSLDRLTIGFARRAAPYKRGDLIFTDESRLKALFDRGLQLIFAGKAHPNDMEGKAIVSRLYQEAQRNENVVFLEDYDMALGKLLTRGCDVWLNNPIRPMEASGTSGMKAAMNGVLNVSVLDGWWAEGCMDRENGWQFGDGRNGEGNDAPLLYDVLEREVIPTYYENHGRWVAMMERSIDTTAGTFSAQRMVGEYYREMYR